MRCSKKIFLPLTFVLITITSYTQEGRQYSFDDIGWQITIPYDFTLYDFIDQARNMQETDEPGEYNNTMDLFFSQTNIIAIKDRFNYFNITTTPFDAAEDGSWDEVMKNCRTEAYNNMTKILEGATIDTVSSIEYFDGMAFNKFHIALSLNNEVKLHLFLLSKLYRGYDFSISYLNINNEARQQIELMLRSSRFKR